PGDADRRRTVARPQTPLRRAEHRASQATRRHQPLHECAARIAPECTPTLHLPRLLRRTGVGMQAPVAGVPTTPNSRVSPPRAARGAVRRCSAVELWLPDRQCVLRLSPASPCLYRVTVPVNVERTGELGSTPYTASLFPLPLSPSNSPLPLTIVQ